METPQEYARLLTARLLGEPLTDAENRKLDDWLAASEANAATFRRLDEDCPADRLLELERSGYGRRMADRFSRELRRRRRRRLWGRVSLAVAAAACLVLAVLFVGQGTDGREDADGRTAALAPIEIQPGRAVATLTLADGRQFELEEMTGAGVRALTDSLHRTTAAGDAPTAYNTLDIPAGGEYAYVLPDGTKVRLNSMTRLRYPADFTGSERRVELQGEAYFEVAHDARRPFIVRTGRGDITVYGTRFNVTDYADSPFAAVLVSGSIGFRPAQGGQTVRLRPSELLTCDADGHTTVTTVDPSVYTAWVDHRFVFRGQTLESIMTTLARWYDFTPVFHSDEARRIRLSGRLNRHEDIRVLLRSYEATTGLTFRIEGRNIVITP